MLPDLLHVTAWWSPNVQMHRHFLHVVERHVLVVELLGLISTKPPLGIIPKSHVVVL